MSGFESLEKPYIIAHKGYSAKYPGNTWQAIVEAYNSGADMCEVDIVLTKDKLPFVYHNLMHDGKPINKCDSAMLRHYLPDHPTLCELLDWAIDNKKKLLLDIKDRNLVYVLPECLNSIADIDIVAKYVIISSFDAIFVRQFKRILPNIQTCLIVGNIFDSATIVYLAKNVQANYVLLAWEDKHPLPHHLLDPRILMMSLKHNVPIITWHEERPYVLMHLIKKPVYGICTNDPKLVSDLIMNQSSYR